MSIHFSKRFDRNFQDDDWLDRREAGQVLSENSGHLILPEYLAVLEQRDQLHPKIVASKRKLYQYAELCFLKVAPQGGHKMQENPSLIVLPQKLDRELHVLNN